MSHPLLLDPFVAAEIDAAVRPYAHRLSAEELAWMREQLAVVLDEDPEARILLRQAHPVPIEQSGEQPRIGNEEAAQSPPVQRKQTA